MPPTNRRSKLQFFIHLPSEIVIDIVSRLPIRTIAICKCVCRSWRDLLRTREFADFHLSKSVPGLVIGEGLRGSGPGGGVEVYEFDDELGLEHHDFHYHFLTKIDSRGFAELSILVGSANGLLLLLKILSLKVRALYVCNPITREYIELPHIEHPHDDRSVYSSTPQPTYGFGVSRVTGQYKVVSISHDSISRIYVLGTGMWRSIGPAPPIRYNCFQLILVPLNGNLHWLVEHLDCPRYVSCFDLETENFSVLSLPLSMLSLPLSEECVVGLGVLGDCLCVSDSSSEDEVVIWLMKEYGNSKSWTKEFVISKDPDFDDDGFPLSYDIDDVAELAYDLLLQQD